MAKHLPVPTLTPKNYQINIYPSAFKGAKLVLPQEHADQIIRVSGLDDPTDVMSALTKGVVNFVMVLNHENGRICCIGEEIIKGSVLELQDLDLEEE